LLSKHYGRHKSWGQLFWSCQMGVLLALNWGWVATSCIVPITAPVSYAGVPALADAVCRVQLCQDATLEKSGNVGCFCGPCPVTVMNTAIWIVTAYSSETAPTFRRNISPPFSVLKSETSKKPAEVGLSRLYKCGLDSCVSP
jgi:hypothetical protein